MNQALDLRPSAPGGEPALVTPANLILVADDEPLTRRLLARQMTSIGYQVALAETGAETLRQAATLNPDVILLDVLMPDMDGFEVCRRLRSEPHLADVPIIMITGLEDRDAYLAGLCAGADDFMRKPVDRVELEIRLSNIMRLNRYRRRRKSPQSASSSLIRMDQCGSPIPPPRRCSPASPRRAGRGGCWVSRKIGSAGK